MSNGGNRLVIRKTGIASVPVIIDDFATVEFYGADGSLSAVIQTLGEGVFGFSSKVDKDWRQVVESLGIHNGDVDVRKKKTFFKSR